MPIHSVEGFARRLVKGIQEQVAGQVALVIWPDGAPHPFAAVWANAAGHASLARRLCNLALAEPRPTDCACCGEAWDRLQAAALALEPPDPDTPSTCH